MRPAAPLARECIPYKMYAGWQVNLFDTRGIVSSAANIDGKKKYKSLLIRRYTPLHNKGGFDVKR